MMRPLSIELPAMLCNIVFDNTPRCLAGCALFSSKLSTAILYKCTSLYCDRVRLYSAVQDAQRQPPIMRVSTSLLPVLCTTVKFSKCNLYQCASYNEGKYQPPPASELYHSNSHLYQNIFLDVTCTNVPSIMREVSACYTPTLNYALPV